MAILGIGELRSGFVSNQPFDMSDLVRRTQEERTIEIMSSRGIWFGIQLELSTFSDGRAEGSLAYARRRLGGEKSEVPTNIRITLRRHAGTGCIIVDPISA